MSFPTISQHRFHASKLHFAGDPKKTAESPDSGENQPASLTLPDNPGEDTFRSGASQAESSEANAPFGVQNLLGIIQSLPKRTLPILQGFGPSAPATHAGGRPRLQKAVSFQHEGHSDSQEEIPLITLKTGSGSSGLKRLLTEGEQSPLAAIGEATVEDDSGDEGASSIMYKSTHNLGTPLEEPPAMPSPLIGFHRSPDSSAFATKDPSALPSRHHSRRATGASLFRPYIQPANVPSHITNMPSESFESEEEEDAHVTDDSDLDSIDRQLYLESLENSSAEDASDEEPGNTSLEQGRHASQPFAKSEPLQLPQESFITQSLKTMHLQPRPSRSRGASVAGSEHRPEKDEHASTSGNPLVKEYRTAEEKLRKELKAKARKKSEKSAQQLLKLTPGEVGKNSLRWQHKLLVTLDDMNRLLVNKGIETRDVSEVNAELASVKLGLNYKMEQLVPPEQLEQAFPFSIRDLSDDDAFHDRLIQFVYGNPEQFENRRAAEEWAATKWDLYTQYKKSKQVSDQRQQIIEEQPGMDALEGRYTTLQTKARRIEEKLRIYQELRENDIRERLSELPQTQEEQIDLRYHFEQNYTISEIEQLRDKLQQEVLEANKQPGLMTVLGGEQKDQLFSEQFLKAVAEKPVDLFGEPTGQAEPSQKKPETDKSSKVAEEQMAFLDTVISLQKVRNNNIFTQMERHITRHGVNSKVPIEKLSGYTLAELISARAALQQDPLYPQQKIKMIDSVIKLKKGEEEE